MNTRRMGKTGLSVSELCLGAMTFGRESTEDISNEMLNRFVEAGGNFIDTADAYSAGVSEEILGRWLKSKQRHELVIATKVRWGTREGANNAGLSRKHILDAVEGSLRRLGTDYLDLYQVHMWDPYTPIEETLRTLDGLLRDGKVRYLGVSNFSGWQLQKAIDISKQMGWEQFTCLQPLYNLLDRELEWELMPICLNEGLGIIPWSPLRGGWLSGKYQRGMSAAPEGTRVEEAERRGWTEGWSVYGNEHTWGVIDALEAVGKEAGKSVAQVALNWLLQRPGVTAPIIGARTMAQFEDNMGATGWSLSTDQMERLNKASAKTLPYPYNYLSTL
ncbi:MAG: aldo/keto reductase [Anaerolineae bacterium]|nr:aldo/keto reductase [Anaerolineae bacterium]